MCFYIWEVADDLPLVSALVKYTAYDAVAAFRLFYALWVVAPLTDGAGKVCGMLTVRPRRERENRFLQQWTYSLPCSCRAPRIAATGNHRAGRV